MTFTKSLVVLFLLNLYQSGVHGRVLNKREIDHKTKNVTAYNGSPYEKSLLADFEEKNLEQEILQELNHLGFRKQREIFVDLERQNGKFNATQKTLVSSESEMLSPLNVEELKNIRKTIKATNSSLPAIRNKRTLNFLLNLVARAMGYTLTPSNPDAEWIPRQQPQPSAQPCNTPPPPCRPSPPSTPPPCAMPPPTTPPCPGSGALMQSATVPPNQINPNTISYPYRPARTIPLFNFAPLPAGIRVPYPPLLQPPVQQVSPCSPPQPSPAPCSTPPPPPCGTTPAPSTPQPCKPNSPPAPPPCGTTPPPPPPCGTTPAPPPPCTTPAPQPPPCRSPPPSKPQPCNTTPAPPPPCTTSAPPPPCTTPPPSPPPCAPPASPPPCGPPAAPPSKPSKKESLVLEYENPVRIEIFSNDKKYLPASGSVYSGDYDDEQQDWHSHFFPSNEKSKSRDSDDFEEEEMQEEHVEEEEEDESPGQLQHYEEEDEQSLANTENEEDESETNLSVVKKPIDLDIKKTQRRKAASSKTKSVTSVGGKKNEKEGSVVKYETKEKTSKMKKPKRKKWVRIVKKQRRKTKTDSSPQDNFQVYTSDSLPEGSRFFPKVYGSMSKRAYDSYDVSDFSSDSGSQSSEDLEHFKKITVNKKQIHSPDLENAYEFNINPYAHALEPEEARRAKLEKAVEKYVEDYVEKQLGQELIKNTGIPKTTVFEFAPKNGPKIQTITTTVAKASHSGPASSKVAPQRSTSARPIYRNPNSDTHVVKKSNYEQTLKKRGNTYEAFTRKF